MGIKMSEEMTLTFMRKDYIFSKDPHGNGILINIDGVRVLLPTHIIIELLKS